MISKPACTNARATEQRLVDVLNNRTGKVGDILQVEQEISRTREQIERMEAQRQNLMKRVEMATVTLTLAEEFKAQLEPTPIGTSRQLWNALVDGYDNFAGSILGIALFLARYGLSLILWGGMCWLGWRAVRRPVKRMLDSRGMTDPKSKKLLTDSTLFGIDWHSQEESANGDAGASDC